MRRVDHTGKTYGRLTFLFQTRPGYWRVRCVCGFEKEVWIRPIVQGEQASVHHAKSKHDELYDSVRDSARTHGVPLDPSWGCVGSFASDVGPVRRGYALHRKAPKLGWLKDNVEWRPIVVRLVPGAKFARLTLLKRVGRGYHKFRCDCGKVKTICGYNVRAGKVRSCGCLRQEYWRRNG